MRGHHACFIALITVAALATATPATAQDPPVNLNRTPVELAVGKDVKVRTKDGDVRTGRLLAASAAEIVVLDGRRRYPIPMTNVRQIDRRSPAISVRKSTLIGLGVGVAAGAASLAFGGCEEDAGTFAVECVGLFAGIGAGAGAVTGWLINTWRPSRTIFRADGHEFRFVPVVSRNRAGFVGTIRW